MRGLNYQASKLQAEEKDASPSAEDRASAISTGQKKEMITKSSKLFPSGTDQTSSDPTLASPTEGVTMTELDQATSLAMHAAARITQSISCSPNIQAALSWMEAIRRREPSPDNEQPRAVSGQINSESSMNETTVELDDEYLDQHALSRKRAAAESPSDILSKKVCHVMEVN